MSPEQWAKVLREYCYALLGVVQPYVQESADALEAVISGQALPTKETILRQAYSMRCQALVFEVLQDRPNYLVHALRYAVSTSFSTDEPYDPAGDALRIACAHAKLLILFFESVVRCVEVSEEV
jgi:prophage DNA circulation protein